MAERRRGRALAIPTMCAAAALVPVLAAVAKPADAADTASRCRVATVRPVAARPSFNLGNRRIAVALPPRATFVAVPDGEPGWAWVQDDGVIRTKVGWWRARGTLRITGRRLDRRASPLRVHVGPLSSSSSGLFVPSLLYFPTTGCWKITATAGDGRLEAVVRVVKG